VSWGHTIISIRAAKKLWRINQAGFDAPRRENQQLPFMACAGGQKSPITSRKVTPLLLAPELLPSEPSVVQASSTPHATTSAKRLQWLVMMKNNERIEYP
jgi:hypothetical protein